MSDKDSRDNIIQCPCCKREAARKNLFKIDTTGIDGHGSMRGQRFDYVKGHFRDSVHPFYACPNCGVVFTPRGAT